MYSKEKLVNYLRNVYGIVDNIFAVVYDDDNADHNRTISEVLKICRKWLLKLNKLKCDFRSTSILVFGTIVSRHGVKPDLTSSKHL